MNTADAAPRFEGLSRQLALAVDRLDPARFLRHEIGRALPSDITLTSVSVDPDTIVEQGDQLTAPVTVYFVYNKKSGPYFTESSVPGLAVFEANDAGVNVTSLKLEASIDRGGAESET